jgi:hypothetical protein
MSQHPVTRQMEEVEPFIQSLFKRTPYNIGKALMSSLFPLDTEAQQDSYSPNIQVKKGPFSHGRIIALLQGSSLSTTSTLPDGTHTPVLELAATNLSTDEGKEPMPGLVTAITFNPVNVSEIGDWHSAVLAPVEWGIYSRASHDRPAWPTDSTYDIPLVGGWLDGQSTDSGTISGVANVANLLARILDPGMLAASKGDLRFTEVERKF